MDQLLELISSENFKYLIAGAVLSGLISWYISKHFFISKSASPLKLAKHHKRTNFGNSRNIALEPEDETINHPTFGTLTIKGNGTWVDAINKLMWTRSAWGTKWDGTHFVGEASKLNWYDASNLFGKGAAVNGVGAHLPETHIAKSKIALGYKKGRCTVSFAGHHDWRLPTAFELNTIGFQDFIRDSKFESFHLKHPKALRERLFPGLKEVSNNYCLWSANPCNDRCAWAIDGNWPPGDIRYSSEYFVIFVRNI